MTQEPRRTGGERSKKNDELRGRLRLLLEQKSGADLGSEVEALRIWVSSATGGIKLSDRETLQAYLNLLDYAQAVWLKRNEDWDQEMRRRGDVFYNDSMRTQNSNRAKNSSPSDVKRK